MNDIIRYLGYSWQGVFYPTPSHPWLTPKLRKIMNQQAAYASSSNPLDLQPDEVKPTKAKPLIAPAEGSYWFQRLNSRH